MPKDNDAATAASGDNAKRIEEWLVSLSQKIDAIDKRLAALERAFPISAKQAPKTTPE